MFVSGFTFLGTPKLTGIPSLKVSNQYYPLLRVYSGPSIDETRQKIESIGNPKSENH